jgi:hypothetical protein
MTKLFNKAEWLKGVDQVKRAIALIDRIAKNPVWVVKDQGYQSGNYGESECAWCGCPPWEEHKEDCVHKVAQEINEYYDNLEGE